MKFISILAPLLFLLVATLVNANPPGSHDPEIIAAKRVKALHAKYVKTVEGILKHRKTGCTLKTVRRRKEWNALTKPERLSYITSLHCLSNLPARTPTTLVPGVRTHYDDFVASHALRTPFVHQNGIFLSFHRHLIHLFETALRDSCGYRGALPYWDWSISWEDVNQSPIFDGSKYSLGSNGVFVPNRTAFVFTNPFGKTTVIPPGTGGGCVYKGPFREGRWEVRLGPFTDPKGPDGGFGFNPRCLERDLQRLFGTYTRPSNVSYALGCGDLACFAPYILESGSGMHGAGHIQMGGIELDVFAAPSDPVFWPHQGMVDRVWAIWQVLGVGRTEEVWGTGTRYNVPPSPNVTLDSPIDFGGVISPTRRMGDLVSSIEGDHCYIYE